MLKITMVQWNYKSCFLCPPQVPVTFMPRDRGDYAQFWDLESHSVTDPQHKTRNRFQFCGTVSMEHLSQNN